MNGKQVICPECEGIGKAVNYFDLVDDPLNIEKAIRLNHNPKRSDGRGYLENNCQVCNGNKYVIVPS